MIIKEISPADTWAIRHIVMWPEKPIDFVKVKGDNEAVHYGLYKDDKLASVISCFETNGEIQFRKFATLADQQRQGIGSYFLNWIIDKAIEKRMRRLWCNARLDKKSFYEKFGLKQVGDIFSKDGIDFVIMEIKFDR